MTLIKYCPVCKGPMTHLTMDPKRWKHHKQWWKCNNCQHGFIILQRLKTKGAE